MYKRQVRYVPRHTTGITGTEHFGKLCTTSIPVPDTSVSSVRHLYRYREYRYRTEHTLGSLWKLPKLVEESMATSTTSIKVCGSFDDFHGSLSGLLKASTASNAREHLVRFPVWSRAVLLVKSRVGPEYRLVSWCESLRDQPNRESDVEVGSCMLIARRFLDTSKYQYTSPQHYL